MVDRDDQYFDDPVEDSQGPVKKKLSSALAFLLLLVGGTYLIQTTFAANIGLNSGRPVEFGQGILATTACSGSTNLSITPNSTFVNSAGAGAFYFSSVSVSNIPSSCNGSDFTINAYGESNSTPIAIFNTSSTNAVIYNNAGVFELGVGTLTGASITSGSGIFTITFTNPVALSSSVFRLTIQSSAHAESGSTGITWTSRTSASDNDWFGVTYGNGLFVAVASSGTGNRVMTSPDGITWTSRTSASDNAWRDVTYGNGLFVAVATSGTGDRVMTSPDGITWTSRTSAADNSWFGVSYGNGSFVAVSASGTGNRVMTSPDGITWTSRTSASDNAWRDVTYGNGLFVAVATSGTGDRVMTSPNGITWTSRTSAANNDWYGVTYGNGTFVAVSQLGSNRVMTSPDGITWTSRTAAGDNNWYAVTYGNGTFVAVSTSGFSQVMTSPDGIAWTIRTSAANNQWYGVTYGNRTFVAVSAYTGIGNRVMTSTP